MNRLEEDPHEEARKWREAQREKSENYLPCSKEQPLMMVIPPEGVLFPVCVILADTSSRRLFKLPANPKGTNDPPHPRPDLRARRHPHHPR